MKMEESIPGRETAYIKVLELELRRCALGADKEREK